MKILWIQDSLNQGKIIKVKSWFKEYIISGSEDHRIWFHFRGVGGRLLNESAIVRLERLIQDYEH